MQKHTKRPWRTIRIIALLLLIAALHGSPIFVLWLLIEIGFGIKNLITSKDTTA